MKKVITISLSGNAYQLEEEGYGLLTKYLEQAKNILVDDPDKEEILADFERTIAEKCDGHLSPSKNVVTGKEVQTIINDMGPVESAETDLVKKGKPGNSKQTRRLYALPDGAMIGGVANGFAAYINMDVNIVRLLFVVLIFLTSGVWILIYLLMMLVLPEARTPEQKAELRGEKFSAQGVLDRAKQKYANIGGNGQLRKMAEQSKPVFSSLGSFVERLLRLALFLCGIFGFIATTFLTITWITGLSWLVFSHPHFIDQLSTISHWTIGAAMTAAYFIIVLPLSVLAVWLMQTSLRRSLSRKQGLRWLILMCGLWLVSIITLITVGLVVGQRVHDYYETNGTITINHHTECINNNLCWGASSGSIIENSSGNFICLKQYCKYGPNGGQFQRFTKPEPPETPRTP